MVEQEERDRQELFVFWQGCLGRCRAVRDLSLGARIRSGLAHVYACARRVLEEGHGLFCFLAFGLVVRLSR